MLGRLFRGATRSEPKAPEMQVADDARIYAIGDIHGRDDLLKLMLERIANDVAERAGDARAPMIVFLGDYIDRGDQSAQVINTLISVRDAMPPGQIRYLMGNHEAALLKFLDSPERGSNWLRYGGLQTIASYGIPLEAAFPEGEELIVLSTKLREAMGPHVAFLEELEMTIISGEVIFCHAGLDPHSPLDAQSSGALLWGESDFIEEGGYEGWRVVHGHFDDVTPVMTPRRICVDTGAYYSGRLTAVRLDGAEELIVADILNQV